jgi:hypothetical protein
LPVAGTVTTPRPTTTPTASPTIAYTCDDYYKQGIRQDGVYSITINGAMVSVYCIMASEDDDKYFQEGGYTVIQRYTKDYNRMKILHVIV